MARARQLPAWQVPALQVLRAARVAVPAQPLFVGWLRDTGTSISGVFWLTTVYSLTVVAAEVPSGRISDRCGRRATLTAACVLLSASYALAALSADLWWALSAAHVLKGLGAALFTGTDAALLYETLAARGEAAGGALRRESRNVFWTVGAESLSGAAGGLAAEIVGARAVVAASALPFALCAVLAFSMVDPPRPARPSAGAGAGTAEALSACAAPPLRSVFAIGVGLNVLQLLSANLSQLILASAGTTHSAAGALAGACSTCAALSALAAPAVRRRGGSFARCGAWLLILCAAAFACLAAGSQRRSSMLAVAGAVLMSAVRGVTWPLTGTQINADVGRRDHVRATVLSVFSASLRLSVALAGPAVGLVAERAGVPAACLGLSAAAAASSVLCPPPVQPAPRAPSVTRSDSPAAAGRAGKQ
eukprot:TRINITY_DN15216_c0_g1_i1.p1 TRINITY_DN15216_c0_g1~~TRINITY_DN15216_c0_g1_i1.p1  ORF type:complete len:444 (+),score=141.41 TRINITY_DN15216_c0_g1_i1:71-1333(+)